MQIIARQSDGPLDPIVAKARTQLREMLALLVQTENDPLVLVACSGGPDSVALAATAAFVAPRLGARVGAVIVDHGLQEGSARAAANAARECELLGLDSVVIEKVRVSLEPGSGGLEAAARSARYGALTKQLEHQGARAILLGHTLDDQAEQVLLALARGSGTRAIAGIPAVRDPFYRPFLQMRRSETVHICKHLGLKVWFDPTNEVPAHRLSQEASSLMDLPRRTVVRDVLLPTLEQHLGPGIAPALARTASLARADEEALTEYASKLLERATILRDQDAPKWDLDCHILRDAPQAVRTRALLAACIAIGVPSSALGHVHITALDALVTTWHGQGPVDLPGSHRALRQYGTLNLYRYEPAN